MGNVYRTPFSFFIDTTLHLNIQFFFVSCRLLPILINCCLPTWFKNSCYTFPMFLANCPFLVYTFPDLRTRDTTRGVPGHVLQTSWFWPGLLVIRRGNALFHHQFSNHQRGWRVHSDSTTLVGFEECILGIRYACGVKQGWLISNKRCLMLCGCATRWLCLATCTISHLIILHANSWFWVSLFICLS